MRVVSRIGVVVGYGFQERMEVATLPNDVPFACVRGYVAVPSLAGTNSPRRRSRPDSGVHHLSLLVFRSQLMILDRCCCCAPVGDDFWRLFPVHVTNDSCVFFQSGRCHFGLCDAGRG
jgi:hypothetical protein